MDNMNLGQIFLIFFVPVMYLLPTITAKQRHHNNVAPIALLNILFGWTIIGWFIPLVWSLTDNRSSKTTSFWG